MGNRPKRYQFSKNKCMKNAKYQRDANQNHSELHHLSPERATAIKKTEDKTCWEGLRDRQALHAVWEHKSICRCGKEDGVPRKAETRTALGSVRSAPWCVSRKCLSAFTVASPTRAEKQQSLCPSTDAWIKKIDAQTQEVLFSHKHHRGMSFATPWMEMEIIILIK